MPDVAGLVRVIHALVGILFVGSLIGRWFALNEAARATTVADVKAMLRVSSRFETTVIWSSTVVLVLGIATAIAQGRPFLGPFQGANVDWLFVSLILYLSVIPLVPLVFLPRGRVFEQALAEAEAAGGSVTPALSAAFRDPVVFRAHVYELAIVTAVTVLMIAKPF